MTSSLSSFIDFEDDMALLPDAFGADEADIDAELDGIEADADAFAGMSHGRYGENGTAVSKNISGALIWPESVARVEQFELARWPDQRTGQGSDCRTSSCTHVSCGAICL